MRRLLSVAFVLANLVPLFAADEPKTNVLTPQEIADGWILLFDGDTTFGWKGQGDAKVDNGVLVIGGKDAASLATTTQFGYGELSFDYGFEGKGKATVALHGEVFSVEVPDRWFRATLRFSTDRVERTTRKLTPDGAQGSVLTRKLRDTLGTSAVSVSVPADAKLLLRNVKLRPFGVTPLFNGKDLAGWVEHPNKKSKFSVEDETIRIKDGPGDLQSEGAWGDFVLQLECKTNGKHLNSGVFFRCRPKEYQNGYEAQIQNGFGPDKEYAIETYDPESGKVIDTKKTKFAAMDYGTGAIYRRIPARKQLAQDNEWFTMTVVAQGRHIATWVNGVQAVDWTDTRKPSDNARTGYRAEKGPISFQGHDPTTDLSFRNIRIGELTK